MSGPISNLAKPTLNNLFKSLIGVDLVANSNFTNNLLFSIFASLKINSFLHFPVLVIIGSSIISTSF